MRKKRQTPKTKSGAATPALIAAVALLGASLGVSGGDALAQGSKSPKLDKLPSDQTDPNQGLSKKPQSKQAEPDKKPVVQQDVTANKQKSATKVQDQYDNYIKQ